jgi:hypothetical protein
LSAATLLFGLFALVVARPLPFLVVLRRTTLSRAGRLMIAWFGPRGLNSLLLAVIAIAAGIPAPKEVFGIVSVVVVLSMIVHGASATPVLTWYGRSIQRHDVPEEVAVDAGTLFAPDGVIRNADQVPRMTVDRLARMQQNGEPVTVIDVRRESALERSGLTIPGSIRIPVDDLRDRLAAIPRDRPVVLWCT